MFKILRVIFLISLFSTGIPSHRLFGQEKEGTVKYTPEFKFNDGIYLNFDQVKLNSPIPKAKLLTSVDYNDREFFKKILEGEKIYFYDTFCLPKVLIHLVHKIKPSHFCKFGLTLTDSSLIIH